MMKAKKEDDGQIAIYNELPSRFRGVTGNYVGGFHLSDTSTLELEGFFDVLVPSCNQVLEVLSPIYFDEEKRVFTYKVEPNPTLPTIEQAKIDKIAELKKMARDKFSETDWYYVRELRMNDLGIKKAVPQNILKQTEDLYSLLDAKEAEINSQTDLESILTFDVSVVKAPAMGETPIIPEVAKTSLPGTSVDLSAYTVALLAVKEGDYTADSWAVYQSVLSANTVTEVNTQEEINLAVDNIKKAQNNLTLLPKDSTTPAPDTSSSGSVPTTSQSSATPDPAPVITPTPDPTPAISPTPTPDPAPVISTPEPASPSPDSVTPTPDAAPTV